MSLYEAQVEHCIQSCSRAFQEDIFQLDEMQRGQQEG